MLVVQNRTQKEYSDEDVEVLQATAMVVAEHLVSGAVAGAGTAIEIEKSLSAVIQGEQMSEGIALGHIVLHEPRIVVTQLMAEDPADGADPARDGDGERCALRSTRCSITSICRAPASIATCSKPTACSPTTTAGSGACARRWRAA